MGSGLVPGDYLSLSLSDSGRCLGCRPDFVASLGAVKQLIAMLCSMKLEKDVCLHTQYFCAVWYRCEFSTFLWFFIHGLGQTVLLGCVEEIKNHVYQ